MLKWTGYGYRRVTHELARRGQPDQSQTRPTGHARRTVVMPTQTAISGHHRLDAQRTSFCKSAAHSGCRPTQPSLASRSHLRSGEAGVCVPRLRPRQLHPRNRGLGNVKIVLTRPALAALNNALAARNPAPGLLHHSDQGSQYASRVYVDRPAGGWAHSQHVQKRQSLRQRPHGEFLQNPENRGSRSAGLSRLRRRTAATSTTSSVSCTTRNVCIPVWAMSHRPSSPPGIIAPRSDLPAGPVLWVHSTH